MDKSNLPAPILNYIIFVENTMAEYKETMQLAKDDHLTPSRLNTALANYMVTGDKLLGMYAVAKAERLAVETNFEEWHDDKFMGVKQKVQAQLDKDGKTSKPAVKELETQVRVENKIEYYALKRQTELAIFKERYFLRLVERFNRYDHILVALSNNMRQEMRTLNLENRMNYDSTRNRVRALDPKATRVPVEDV